MRHIYKYRHFELSTKDIGLSRFDENKNSLESLESELDINFIEDILIDIKQSGIKYYIGVGSSICLNFDKLNKKIKAGHIEKFIRGNAYMMMSDYLYKKNNLALNYIGVSHSTRSFTTQYENMDMLKLDTKSTDLIANKIVFNYIK